MESRAALVETFSDFIQEQTSLESADIQSHRQTAFEAFSQLGLPNKRQDHWKYLNWSPIPIDSYGPAAQTPVSPEAIDAATAHLLEIQSPYTFVFINGQLIDSLSPGLKQSELDFHQEPTSPSPKQYTDGFSALNDAFSSQTIQIRVKENQVLDAPIVLAEMAYTTSNPLMVHPKSHLYLEANAKATLLKQTLGLGASPVFINEQLNVSLETGAELNHYDIHHNHTDGGLLLSQCSKTLAEKATSNAFISSFGAGVSRHEQTISLNGEQACSQLHALHMGHQQQERDITVTVSHQAPNCQSQTVARGVFDDLAKGTFTGKILVQEFARETNADLENKNILLSQTAEANSRPQLEVYNDEVKCSHGSTVGHLEPEALFYLQSRGLPLKEAKQMLINAFLAKVTESLEHPVIKDYVNSNLPWSLKADG